MNANGRRQERITTVLPVDAGIAKGLTRDVSPKGIYFETDDMTFNAGADINIDIELATPSGNMIMHCEGVLVRVEAIGNGTGIAIKVKDASMSQPT